MDSHFAEVASAKLSRVAQAAQAPSLAATRRALDLPLRPVRDVPDQTPHYAKTGQYALRPIQSKALLEVEQVGGLFGPIGVGHGKTIITMLVPEAMRRGGFSAKRTLLLLPSALVDKAVRERFELLPHLKVDTRMRILSYESLSTAKATDLLDRLQPDLIICDEAHSIANKHSSRYRRLARYARSNPSCRFVFVSGSFSNASIEEYAHLLRLALKEGTPLPDDHKTLKSWAAVLDQSGTPKAADYVAVRPLLDWAGKTAWEEGEEFTAVAREAFQKRLLGTLGVVATSDSAIGSGIILREVSVVPPDCVLTELERLEETWQRPDGEELEDAIAMARNRRHLLQGFYHVWDWPDGVVDEEWMEARAAWHKALRNFLHSPKAVAHRDSPLLLRRWVMRGAACSCGGAAPSCRQCRGTGRVACNEPDLVGAWEAWSKVRDRPAPPVRVVWVDKFLVWEALDRATLTEEATGKPVIIWTLSRALHAEMAKHLPAYGPGEDPPLDNPHTCVMSVRSHGTGRNLQSWSQGLLTLFIGSNKRMEQLLGRTHRPGQESEEVVMEYLHPHEVLDRDVQRAVDQANFVASTKNMRQKLLMASWEQG